MVICLNVLLRKVDELPSQILMFVCILLPTWNICSCHGVITGALEDLDEQRIIFSLMERFYHFLIQGQALSSAVVSNFLSAYPECNHFFQH